MASFHLVSAGLGRACVIRPPRAGAMGTRGGCCQRFVGGESWECVYRVREESWVCVYCVRLVVGESCLCTVCGLSGMSRGCVYRVQDESWVCVYCVRLVGGES